jgi:Uma2 family endonuclease
MEVTMAVELRRRRFTVDEYYTMADAGILTEDDRVELIEGEIVQMAAIGSLHAACVDRLNRLLVQQAGEAALVRVQNPVRLSDLSEPQPDLALLRPRTDYYAAGHPGPSDTLLIIEVAHSTLAYDREIKVPLYAVSGIPETWVVDLEGGEVRVYREATKHGYDVVISLLPGALLSPQLVPQITVAVADLVG